MLVNDKMLDEKFEKEYEKLRNEVEKPGILLAGATGVGKSSLVNMIFGINTAVTGVGRPVTEKIDCFDTRDSSVRIYDSAGYETNESGDEKFFRDVIGMVKNPAQHAVNIIWYCISCLGARVTDYDANAVKEFANAGCPVAVVLTKADKVSDDDVAALKKAVLDVANVPIFETSCLLKEYNQLNALVDWSVEKLPAQLQFAFIAQQRCSFEQKRKRVRIAIAEHVVGAGLIGGSPIPFSDAPMLAANEVALMTRILYLYDLGGLGNALKSVSFGSLLSKLGKSAVGNFLKMLPGLGSIVGGVINASVAVAITWAFGGAVSLTCERIWKEKLDGKNVDSMLNDFGNIVQRLSEDNIRNKKTSETTIF